MLDYQLQTISLVQKFLFDYFILGYKFPLQFSLYQKSLKLIQVERKFAKVLDLFPLLLQLVAVFVSFAAIWITKGEANIIRSWFWEWLLMSGIIWVLSSFQLQLAHSLFLLWLETKRIFLFSCTFFPFASLAVPFIWRQWELIWRRKCIRGQRTCWKGFDGGRGCWVNLGGSWWGKMWLDFALLDFMSEFLIFT